MFIKGTLTYLSVVFISTLWVFDTVIVQIWKKKHVLIVVHNFYFYFFILKNRNLYYIKANEDGKYSFRICFTGIISEKMV